ITLQRCIDAIHDIDVILAAPFVDDTAFELLAVAGRTARVREQDGIAFRRINLKLVIPIDTILSRGPAMDAENQRILFAGLPANRFDEESIDVPIVGALVSEALDIGKLQFLPQRLVQLCELACVLSI